MRVDVMRRVIIRIHVLVVSYLLTVSGVLRKESVLQVM